MTWTWTLTEASELEVYDHNGNHVTTVVTNDDSGYRIPDDIEECMMEVILSQGVGTLSKWQKATLVDLAGTDIEEREG